jgi:hypothetical protein
LTAGLRQCPIAEVRADAVQRGKHVARGGLVPSQPGGGQLRGKE